MNWIEPQVIWSKYGLCCKGGTAWFTSKDIALYLGKAAFEYNPSVRLIEKQFISTKVDNDIFTFVLYLNKTAYIRP